MFFYKSVVELRPFSTQLSSVEILKPLLFKNNDRLVPMKPHPPVIKTFIKTIHTIKII